MVRTIDRFIPSGFSCRRFRRSAYRLRSLLHSRPVHTIERWTVGDETLPFFSVSLWQKLLRRQCVAFAGDVVLLQSKDISSLQCSIHRYESLISKGVDDLLAGSQVGSQ